ncbi:MAG: hypothetical protein S0880_28615 [Actinomycetota bacterium]|nr:hypothetical protein [Actinomycetota bacterium]
MADDGDSILWALVKGYLIGSAIVLLIKLVYWLVVGVVALVRGVYRACGGPFELLVVVLVLWLALVVLAAFL